MRTTLLVLILAALFAAPLRAQDDLDKQLLDDLDAELLKDLEQPPAKKPVENSATDQVPAANKTDSQPNPLTKIMERMRKVESLIAATDASKSTQSVQREVLADLDRNNYVILAAG